MKIIKNVYYLQAKNIFLALQIGTIVILLGESNIFNLRIELFTPFKYFRISYIFSNFWLGYYLCGLINKLIKISPRCFIKFYLDLYELTKKFRDK
jgi:hypothetical protein